VSGVERPVLTLDLAGVIVQPPLGWNVAISRRLDVPPLPPTVRRVNTGTRWRRGYWMLRTGLEVARYTGRRPLPGVREALAALADRRRLFVLSGRRWVVRPLVERWLERYGLAPYVSAVYLNDAYLPSAQYKLHTLQGLGASEHVDDDGATAYYLARHGGITVYLCDWPRNRGLPYPGTVQVVRNLSEVVRYLAGERDRAPG
jgi:FMN phosphatase YigB (HAD superfamily)